MHGREVESVRRQIPFCIVGRPLLIGSHLRSGENVERITVGLLDQARSISCVRECVSTLRARYDPACHQRAAQA
jgi:hypothetical protein